MRDEELLARRLAIIQKIVTHPKDIGKTKIQKIVYFLQEAVGVPLMYPFRMHYYGPYSDDLDGVLSLANSLGHIDIKPAPSGFGYLVTPSQENEDNWLQEYDISKDADVDIVDRAIYLLGSLDTSTLELYATVHFIDGPDGNLSKDEVLNTVSQLKPKFTRDFIERAYQALLKANLISRKGTT